jgi:alkaline phosphatase D
MTTMKSATPDHPSPAPAPTHATRRQFLKTLTVAVGTVMAGAWPALAQAAARIAFPQSVASGDPHADSVILWTRAVNAATGAAEDVDLILQVSQRNDFATLDVAQTFTARAASDGCLRIRVVGLQADTPYYYRFVSIDGISRTGRTRTAPAPTATRNIRFAFVSCQDYVGRYYNTYLRLLEGDHDDLDFVVHLGDYIYETTGDPSFQNVSGRGISFTDKAGSITLGEGSATYQAARSLDNYRQLYRTYRSDPVLQQIHERFPMIVIWDDHEFSDDCFGDTATYYDGSQTETDLTRRRSAEQAYFEYMPLDVEGGSNQALEVDSGKLYPHNRIYRDFRFGQHLHLVMSDTRSSRPDHLIPEDAYPGQVALPSAGVLAALASIAGSSTAANALYNSLASSAEQRALYAYLDLDTAANAQAKAVLRTVITQQYLAAGLAADAAASRATLAASGNFSLYYANQMLAAAGQAALAVPADAPLGVAYMHLGKLNLFDKLGSRYLVVKAAFDLFALAKGLADLAGQNLFGDAQTQWLTNTLGGSNATWRVFGSSISYAPLVLDLTNVPGVPVMLKQVFYLNLDHWDGFPAMKQLALDALGGWAANNGRAAIVIAGDIHASYVTEHGTAAAKTVCFTGPSVSSGTFGQFVRDTASNIDPQLGALANLLDNFLYAGSSTIRYARSNAHGVVVLDVGADAVDAAYHLLPATDSDGSDLVATSYYANAATLLAKMETVRFRVAGTTLQSL